MIQDIIQYLDEEDEEGIIVFLDQQKAFDRVEWGLVDFVLKGAIKSRPLVLECA
jgi:hypothetical protein